MKKADVTIETPLTLESLSPYQRGLLRLRVPVRVTLAALRQPLASILEITPGTLLRFDKACWAKLELEAGSQPLAEGDCVLLDQQYGLRITGLHGRPDRLPGR